MDLAPMVQVRCNTEAEVLDLVILTNFMTSPPDTRLAARDAVHTQGRPKLYVWSWRGSILDSG